VVFCSIFYEKDGFYCKPKDLPNQEFGGVAVALGQKVSTGTNNTNNTSTNCQDNAMMLSL